MRTPGNQPIITTLLAMASVVLVGCQSAASGDSTTLSGVAKADSATTSVTDLALDALNGDRSALDTFHSEQSGEVLRSVYHLKSTDVTNPPAGSGKFDLCSGDVSQGIGWVSGHYAANPDATLVDTVETEAYYQARWQMDTTPASYRDVRVYKCDYLDRTVYDWYQPGTELGVVDTALSGQGLKERVDYLWYFSPNNNFGNALLRGDITSVDGEPGYRVTELYTQFNWSGGCNSATVMEADYSVDGVSGVVSVDRKLVESFQWRFAADGATRCTANG